MDDDIFGDWEVVALKQQNLVFEKPISPCGLSLFDFKTICKLAETNVTMYEALERLKVTYELLNDD